MSDCLPYFDQLPENQKASKTSTGDKAFHSVTLEIIRGSKLKHHSLLLNKFQAYTSKSKLWQFVLLVDLMFMDWSRLIHSISSSDNSLWFDALNGK